MLNLIARTSVAKVTDPVAGWLLKRGATPNAMTVIGTLFASAAALWFFPRGQLLAGTLVVTAFLMFDLLDGAMARLAGRSTAFGAVLDASCDRIVDGVLFGALIWWAFVVAGERWLGVAALISGIGGQVISYIKARAEATGLRADGGVVERAERFILALLGTGLAGFGVPYAVHIAFWVLAALSVFTVGQRMYLVYRSAQAKVGR